jgi:hypothetical protein
MAYAINQRVVQLLPPPSLDSPVRSHLAGGVSLAALINGHEGAAYRHAALAHVLRATNLRLLTRPGVVGRWLRHCLHYAPPSCLSPRARLLLQLAVHSSDRTPI